MFVKFNKLLNLLVLSISLCYFANARKRTVMKTCRMYCMDGCCWKGSFRSTAFHIVCSLNRYVHYLPNPREEPTTQIGQLNNRVSTEAHTCIICTWTNQNMLRQLTLKSLLSNTDGYFCSSTDLHSSYISVISTDSIFC